MAGANAPFKLVEGFRSTDRQQWLYGSGRPAAKPDLLAQASKKLPLKWL